MKKHIEELNDIVHRMIDSADKQHRDCVERYITLVNIRLAQEKEEIHGICGASAILQRKWEDKFGTFVPRYEAVVDN